MFSRILLGIFSLGAPLQVRAQTIDWSPCKAINFELIDNRIFVNTFVNGHGPFKFILDTGSSSCSIDTPIAKSIGLPFTDPFNVGGVGPNKSTGYHTKVSALSVENIPITNLDTVIIPTENITNAIGFNRFEGIVGVQFFNDHIIGIDYLHRVIHVCPTSFDDHGLGDPIPLGFQDGTFMPFLSAKIDGVQGNFLIDTGDRSTLTVFEDFSAQNSIEKHYQNVVNMITGEGVGGPVLADVLRLKDFSYGTVNFTDFATRFPAKSVFSVDGFAGNLGNGLLSTHDVIFDYPTKTLLILAQNGLGYRQFDRSGLWLVKGQNSFRVQGVVPHSAASDAGLEVDDEIINVNGVSVDRLFLPRVRRTLSSEILPVVNLRVRAKGKTRNVRVQLRELVHGEFPHRDAALFPY